MDIKKKHVWYACYGSNLLKERFMYYIKGGVCKFNEKEYASCSDESAPLDDRPINIPYKLYFGNSSKIWKDGGVAFLEPKINDNETTLGRMYLITEEQFHEINVQEGLVWYDLILSLGELNEIPIKTFTHSSMFTKKLPVQKYLKVIEKGISEAYPYLSKNEIKNHLKPSLHSSIAP